MHRLKADYGKTLVMSMVRKNNLEVRQFRLSGVIAAALTPLSASLEPDLAGVVAHCTRLLANGCDGINLLGTTGEATSLSAAQRMRVMSAVAESGLPLERFMVGTGAAALDDAIRLSAHAVRLGFAGALAVPPFYFKDVSDEGVFRWYAALIDGVGDSHLRLYFYNFPQLSGVTIAPDVIERIVRAYPGIAAGVKDSSGSRPYALELAHRFSDLAIFPSSEAGAGTLRSEGFAGCISATVNLTAPLAQRVWRGESSPGEPGALAAVRTTIARYPMVPAVRYLTSRIRGDESWRRPLPPLEPLSPSDGEGLAGALAAIPAYVDSTKSLAK